MLLQLAIKRVLSFRVQRVICYFERKKTLKNVVVAQGNFNFGLDLCSIREIRDWDYFCSRGWNCWTALSLDQWLVWRLFLEIQRNNFRVSQNVCKISRSFQIHSRNMSKLSKFPIHKKICNFAEIVQINRNCSRV